MTIDRENPWGSEALSRAYDGMLQNEGTTMAFEITRDEETIARSGVNTTFSADAVDGCLAHMRAWLYSRLTLDLRDHPDDGPRTARLLMKVELSR